MEAPAAAHVRARTLDAVRGMAILGILLANILAFGSPMLAESVGGSPNPAMQSTWTEAILLAFVNSKFRSTLAILFGVGLWMQFRRRETAGERWPGTYIRRTLILLGLGLLHAIFLWWGDILAYYAVAALIAVWLVRIPPGFLWALIFGGSFLMLLIALAFGMMGAGGDSDGLLPSAAEEVRIFAHGSYLEQLQVRLSFLGVMLCIVFFTLPMDVPLFALGIQLARHGVLMRPSEHPKARNLMFAVGYGVGLPLNAWVLLFPGGLVPDYAHAFVELFAGPFLAVGYAITIAVWAEKSEGRAVRTLSQVGRMALSNYLLQSLLGTLIFYSFGLGLFGQLNNLELLAFVPIIWFVNIVFTRFWLRRYPMGPIEWAWRRMAGQIAAPVQDRGIGVS